MRIHHILLGLGLSGILASCNVVKMSFRHDAKVFQKSSLQHYTFTDTGRSALHMEQHCARQRR